MKWEVGGNCSHFRERLRAFRNVPIAENVTLQLSGCALPVGGRADLSGKENKPRVSFEFEFK